MRWRDLLVLGVLGFLTACIPAVFQDSPGYMDASYYYLGALNLSDGAGFNEQVLWNYLDDPAGLPHPSHGYWLPLTSIVGWLGITLLGILPTFTAARMPFLLLAACIPPLTALLAYRLSSERIIGLLAGAFAVFSGFYLPYLGIPDSFSINLVLGLIFFLLLVREDEEPFGWKRAFALGLLTGLMHLSRTEGIVWLGVLGVVLGLNWFRSRDRNSIITSAAAVGGYLLIMGPWILRNLIVLGSPLSPGGSQMLWLTDYNQLFIYPPSLLTPGHLWTAGWQKIVQVRWNALVENLWSITAVQGSIVLLPFIIFGAVQFRKRQFMRAAVLGGGLVLLMMSVFFPFAGYRGGFFHAGAVWQGLFWALAAVGFAKAMRFMDRFDRWEYSRALKGVGLIVVMGLAALSMAVTYQKVVHTDWDRDQKSIQQIDSILADLEVGEDEIVLVKNPPSFTVETGRPSIVIPDGSEETLLQVSRRYNARWLILNEHHPNGLQTLYNSPESFDSFSVHAVMDSTYIIEINE